MKRQSTLGLLVLVAALACERGSLSAGSLAGTWVLVDGSRHFLLPEQQSLDSRLLLDSTGTFQASSLPGEMAYLGRGKSLQTLGGEGVWRLDPQHGHQGLWIEFRQIDGLGEVSTGIWLAISPRGSPLRLRWFQGDPDLGRRIEFGRLHQK